MSTVEGDSKSVINWGRGDRGSWRLQHFIHEVKDLFVELKASLQHIPRSMNYLVDSLAKWSDRRQEVLVGDYILEC